jgi:T3SS negative regulator,GrlR
VDLNGLWLAEFSTQSSQGTRVLVLLNGKALGGDANYYYSGSYSLNGAQLSGTLSVTHYSGPLNNVFGSLRSLTLSLSGAAGHDLIVVSGVDKARPQTQATFRLRRAQGL